ncbi:MAG: hypothetical protein MUE73_02310 [Planctomycetes bacterium]|jgi:hypothetical protein|nr:hypothetical protein [Planctomycetota bacterium]
MTRWVVCGVVVLVALSGLARPEEPPAATDGKIQFVCDYPPGVYEYRQAHTGDTWQRMDGRDLSRDHTEMAVTYTMSVWCVGEKRVPILRFVPRRIEAAVQRLGFSGRYDSAGPPAAQSRELADYLSPLLAKTGLLRMEAEPKATGIADGFVPQAGGAASMSLALFYAGVSTLHFLHEIYWVLPEKPRAAGDAWKSKTGAWAIRSPGDRKLPQRVKFERVETDATGGSYAVLTFTSDMPPAGAGSGGAAALSKAEGAHTGFLRYELATRLVREYQDETKWANHFSVGGPMGRSEQVMGNVYATRITVARTGDDSGPLPADLAPAGADGAAEDEEHADD